MASKPNTARQHKHFAVLIDADNALVAIAESPIESRKITGRIHVVFLTYT